MPKQNRFAHQTYTAEKPAARYEMLRAEPPPSPTSSEFAERMQHVGDAMRTAGVTTIYLAHGTFAGTDSLGLLNELARLWPDTADRLRQFQKAAFDTVVGEAANFTPQFAGLLQQSLGGGSSNTIDVRLFHWSSENHHLGRADGAVRLIDQLATDRAAERGRVLLWGHSHAGNVFALLTNLLAADAPTRQRFFDAARDYFRHPVTRKVDLPIWQRVEQLLAGNDARPGGAALDIATFGTPIRYGWDTDGYRRLLHVVNHRPRAELPEYLAAFPTSLDETLGGEQGDFVQQLGIAGTNFLPNALAWRTWRAEARLKRLLQGDLRDRDVLDRLKIGVRVADEGTTLLVDYGPPTGNVAQRVAGHAVYTRRRWMLLHAEQIAHRFYTDTIG